MVWSDRAQQLDIVWQHLTPHKYLTSHPTQGNKNQHSFVTHSPRALRFLILILSRLPPFFPGVQPLARIHARARKTRIVHHAWFNARTTRTFAAKSKARERPKSSRKRNCQVAAFCVYISYTRVCLRNTWRRRQCNSLKVGPAAAAAARGLFYLPVSGRVRSRKQRENYLGA